MLLRRLRVSGTGDGNLGDVHISPSTVPKGSPDPPWPLPLHAPFREIVR